MKANNLRILLVDDNDEIHKDFKQILCPFTSNSKDMKNIENQLFGTKEPKDDIILEDFILEDAYYGDEALAMVENALWDNNPYALIFMDVRMPPGIDGIQTIKKIWEKDKHVEIVICTAYADYSWDQIITTFPSTDQLLFLKKPIDSITIKQITQSLTKKWLLNKKNREYINNLELEIAKHTQDLKNINEQLRIEITENKRVEQERIDLESKLHQAQKMEAIGQLAGGIAHDYNNMLGAISGYAEMMRTKLNQDEEKLLSYVNTIISITDRSADLTAKLLAFARKGNIELIVVDLHDNIDEVIKILEHSLDKRIRIIKYLNAKPATVMADRTRLQNIILNLALNARDAMPDGGELTFSTDIVELDDYYIRSHPYKIDKGTYIRMSVLDTGKGMTEETQAKLFEPFFTTKKLRKGTGLGLASVFGSVKSHNGTLEVYSEIDKGTLFKVYFPLVRDSETKIEEITHSIQRGQGTVLVIDDEEYIRSMVKDMLSEIGYTVVTCTDGEEAIIYYQQHYKNIDLLIIDMIMPNIGGYNCFIKLKQINPQVKALISSGFIENEEVKKIIREGALGFIQKPFNMFELSNMVKNVLDLNIKKTTTSQSTL